MPYKLFLTDNADKEFSEAAKWYDEQSAGLGNRFILTLQLKLKLIQEFPERYPKRYKNFRETMMNVFPYAIVYTFYKAKKEIHVSAIYHSSRNPKRKFRKK